MCIDRLSVLTTLYGFRIAAAYFRTHVHTSDFPETPNQTRSGLAVRIGNPERVWLVVLRSEKLLVWGACHGWAWLVVQRGSWRS
jgi:hypothetical protein